MGIPVRRNLLPVAFLVLPCLLFLFSSWRNVAYAGDLDWGKINPVLKDATSVKGLDDCIFCHEEYPTVSRYHKTYEGTVHAMAFKKPEFAGKWGTECEACHGPLSKHVKKGDIMALVSFGSRGGLSSKQKSAVCLQCHEGESIYWRAGAHEAEGVSCNSCHYVMERRSDGSLLIAEDARESCYRCHPDIRARMLKSSHMPVREGKIDCSSCHDPHNSFGPKMLRGATVNETCYACHAEKRGPFLWEHPPVRENCLNCHDPHGSNNPGLLNSKGPFLCNSCHQLGFHRNQPKSNNALYGQGCINCHSRIHGSNHPSGALFHR